MNHNSHSEETILAPALQMGTPEQSATVLDRACTGHADLRPPQDELLRPGEVAGPLPENPPSIPGHSIADLARAADKPGSPPAGPVERPGMRVRRYESDLWLALVGMLSLDHESVLGGRRSARCQMGKAIHRHRAPCAAVMTIRLVFLVLLAGIPIISWQAIRAMRAGDEQGRLLSPSQAERLKANHKGDRTEKDEVESRQPLRAVTTKKELQAWQEGTARLWSAGTRKELDRLVESNSLQEDTRAGVLAIRANLAARRGDWGLAARDLGESIRLDPEPHWNWYRQAPLLLQSGDTESYRRHCTAMLARFKDTEDPREAERMVKSCLLIPGVTGDDLREIERLAEVAVVNGVHDPALRYFQSARGLVKYRKGDFSGAERCLLKALDGPGIGQRRDWTLYMAGQANPVLAMTQYRLGRLDEARDTLAKVEASEVARIDGDKGESWHDRLIIHLLLQEARELIEGAELKPAEGVVKP